MTEETIQPQGRGCPAWAKILLIGSLALNVAVVGLYAGHAMKDGKDRASGNRQIEWILKLVPEDRRDFTKRHFADARNDLRALNGARLEQLDQIVSAIRNDPFDQAQLESALAGRRDTSLQRREIVHERLLSLMIAFEPEERQFFATGLEARLVTLKERRRN